MLKEAFSVLFVIIGIEMKMKRCPMWMWSCDHHKSNNLFTHSEKRERG